MVSLRLTRMGSKKKPFFRIVAIDSHTRRDGRYIEQIGTYNSLTGEKVVDHQIALKWLKIGAQPSTTVRDIFSKEGILKEFHEQKQSKQQS